MISAPESRQGEVMNRDWAASASASSSLLATAPDGGGMLFWISGILYISFLIRMQCSLKFIAGRYPGDIAPLSLIAFSLVLLGNDVPIVRVQELRAMKNEKLKPTTVRFTDSDLHLIDCLQEKLGLGMIHVIRLAIRRLAEVENLLPSPSTPKKR
jgi:hypothetical protein